MTWQASPAEACLEVTVVCADGIMHRDELGAVREGAFDLNLDEHAGDVGEDVALAEHAAPRV